MIELKFEDRGVRIGFGTKLLVPFGGAIRGTFVEDEDDGGALRIGTATDKLGGGAS